MNDPESPAGPDDDSGSGLSSFLNSTPKVIGSITASIGAISGLLLALNKAGVLGGDGVEAATTTTATTQTQPAESLFSPMRRPVGRVYFDGTTMYVKAAKARAPILLLADQEKSLQEVGMSMSVAWTSDAEDYGYSLLCRYQNARNYYLLGVLSGGRYNIGRYRDGKLTSLTHGLQHSAYIDGNENDVTARCVGDSPTTLSLEVNDHPVASVKDPNGLAGGNVGLRVGSGESTVTLAFKNYVLKYL